MKWLRLQDLPTDNSFAALPAEFYTRLQPRPPAAPRLLHANAEAAALIGLDPAEFSTQAFLDVFSGHAPLPGGDTLAAVYSGHQFGVWAGQLGEVRGPAGGWELQLKGAGMTPYSRMGDGRAVLRSSVREYLASEAMHGLGIPTKRSLALVVSDDPVMRETVETAAVVTRMAPSFVRFGSFEHWSARRQPEQLRVLADYVIDRFYPECRVAGAGRLDGEHGEILGLLAAVTRRTALLMADWQAVGFCHGVMNTDNMSILGLTLDYGPYGFMDTFQLGHICNHSDSEGATPGIASRRWACGISTGWPAACIRWRPIPRRCGRCSMATRPCSRRRFTAAWRASWACRNSCPRMKPCSMTCCS